MLRIIATGCAALVVLEPFGFASVGSALNAIRGMIPEATAESSPAGWVVMRVDVRGLEPIAIVRVANDNGGK